MTFDAADLGFPVVPWRQGRVTLFGGGMMDFSKTYGRDGLMITGAVRYCLGRRTYIVSDCADWIIANWAEWPDSVKSIIKRDIEDEFRRDAENPEWKSLGDDCDKFQWEKVRKLWEE